MGYVRGPLAERFWDKVRKTEGCWEWTAAKIGAGYGCIYVTPMRRMVQAHRVSWLLHHGGFPPKGTNVLHRCDNRLCVRPDHLFLGTQLDNVHDCTSKGRMPDRRGEKNGRAVLDDAAVREARRRLAAGDTRAAIARALGVTWTAIEFISTGKSWRHVA